MRIVSLLPAATEWLFAFGVGEHVVGRSHACDFPPEALALPALTRPTVPTDGSPAEIDRAVRDTLAAGLSVFDVDLAALRALAPDLVVTQTTCNVCAPDLTQLERLLGDRDARPAIHAMDPATYKGVLDAALALGHAAGSFPAAMRVVADGEARLAALHARLGLRRDGTFADGRVVPTVACIEWLDPLMTAGHWAPDLVALAGGRAVCADAGQPSAYVAWDHLRAADPDVLIVAACGRTVGETRADWPALDAQPGWADLRAVRAGRVAVFDGNAHFNRPGPRLVETVEALAGVLFPVVG